MTDLNKDTPENVNNTNSDENANAGNNSNNAATNNNPDAAQPEQCGGGRGRCGNGQNGGGDKPWGRHCGGNGGKGFEHYGRHCHGRKRFKIFGAAFLIALAGFMLGKASSHHHYEHHYGYQQAQPMLVMPYQATNPALDQLLNNIGATPEQRAKAQTMYNR